MDSIEKTDWLPKIGIFSLFLLGSIALYKGAFPPPIRINPLKIEYSSKNVFASTTVVNDSNYKITATVQFELCHSNKGSRFIPPANLSVIPQDVPIDIEPHSSNSVSCKFSTWGSNEENTVSAVITKWQKTNTEPKHSG